MSKLYILSEDENDKKFYEKCVQILAKQLEIEIIKNKSLRRGGGVSIVRKNMRPFLREIRNEKDAYFIIALDNDRSPEHPHHKPITNLPKGDKGKQCRFCEIQQAIEQELGADQSQWPIKGAWAVPVEMLESWLLLILNPDKTEADLPIFPERNKTLAQQYYGNRLTDQLKELCELEKAKRNIRDNGNFCLACAELLDSNQLALQSPSFALFKEQIAHW